MVVVVAALLRCGSGALRLWCVALRLCCGSVSLQGRHEAHRKLPLIATTSEITNVVPLDIRIIDITHRTHSDIFEPSSASPNTANQGRSINNRPAPPQGSPTTASTERSDRLAREALNGTPQPLLHPSARWHNQTLITCSSEVRLLKHRTWINLDLSFSTIATTLHADSSDRNSGGITIIPDADRV
jgi:hypothetical protein